MGYTWGYIKDVILAKLDLDEDEAQVQNLLGRFPLYANEAMTQICSAIKPRHAYFDVIVNDFDVGKIIKKPKDFVSWGGDVNYVSERYPLTGLRMPECREASDEDFQYASDDGVIFLKPGIYKLSYEARWYTFTKDMDNDVYLDIPNDILDCLPSYIAHQCFKIDDETKSAIFRNEYEMFLSRIDDTNFKNTKTFKVGGGW